MAYNDLKTEFKLRKQKGGDSWSERQNQDANDSGGKGKPEKRSSRSDKWMKRQ